MASMQGMGSGTGMGGMGGMGMGGMGGMRPSGNMGSMGMARKMNMGKGGMGPMGMGMGMGGMGMGGMGGMETGMGMMGMSKGGKMGSMGKGKTMDANANGCQGHTPKLVLPKVVLGVSKRLFHYSMELDLGLYNMIYIFRSLNFEQFCSLSCIGQPHQITI